MTYRPARLRLGGTPGGRPLWLVPGRSGSCIDGGDGGCAANDLVRTQGLVLWLLPTTVGPPATFMGILPDGVSVTAKNGDGSTADVARSGAAFLVSVTGSEGGITVHTKTAGDQTTTAGHPPDSDAAQHPS